MFQEQIWVMRGTGELWAPRTVDNEERENPLSLCPCPVQS